MRGVGVRSFGRGLGFRSQRFNTFFFSDLGGYYPYSTYPTDYPYGYGNASACCAPCGCRSGEAYSSPERSDEAEVYYPPIRSGPVEKPPDRAALRADLVRRYPRHIILHFSNQGLAEGETPLEIPSMPRTHQPDKQ